MDMVAHACSPSAKEQYHECGASLSYRVSETLKLEGLVYGLGQKQWECRHTGTRGHTGRVWCWNQERCLISKLNAWGAKLR